MEDLYNELALRRSHEPTSNDQRRRIGELLDAGGNSVSRPHHSPKRNPIVLPEDECFDVNVNVLNGYGIHDIYRVDFDSDSLGDGGFGTVFSGSHQYEPDMPVAIKKISFGVMRANPSSRQRRQRRASRRSTAAAAAAAAAALRQGGAPPPQPPSLPASGGSTSSPNDSNDGVVVAVGEDRIDAVGVRVGLVGVEHDDVEGDDVDDDDDDDYFGSSENGGVPDLRRLVASIEDQIAEIAVLKRFRNDYRVVHLHEYFVSTEPDTRITSLFLVTEFLPGGELFDCIKERITKHLQLDPDEQAQKQPFCEGDVRNIFRTLLEAIQFMHGHSVIHRDLKPSNLLLQVKDAPTSLKVADFGQSKILPVGETTRTSTGTPGYRPPEMYAGEPYRESVDLFSAGCILFFLLAGYQPFASYPKHKIKSKTLRCEYRTNVDSWNRVSKPAKRLVKGLLATADRRLTLEAVLRHEWMCQDDGADDLKKDLTENVKTLVLSLENEVPAPHGLGSNSYNQQHHSLMPSQARQSSNSVHRSAPGATAAPANAPTTPMMNPSLPPRLNSPYRRDAFVDSTNVKRVHFSGNDGIPTAESQRSINSSTQSNTSNRDLPLYHPEPAAAPERQHLPQQTSSAPPSSAQHEKKAKGICDCLFGRSRRDPEVPLATPVEEDETHGEAGSVAEATPEPAHIPVAPAPPLQAQDLVPSSSLSFVRDYAPQDPGHSELSDLVHMGSEDPPGAVQLLDVIASSVNSTDYTEAVARTYVRALFEAVVRLHKSHIVHRSLSVSNFLISDYGHVLIKDMRYACEVELGQDCLSGYCGTPYIITAPEVYTDFSYSEKVDLWSLGIVTYLLLCGVYPFFGTGNEPELRRMAVDISYPFSSTAPSRMARDFVRLLLQPNPGNRPSVQEMMQHEWMRADEDALRPISLQFAFGGFSAPGGFD